MSRRSERRFPCLNLPASPIVLSDDVTLKVKLKIIVKYVRGGLALERFLSLGVEGAVILILRCKDDQQTHVSKSAGNESGDRQARKGSRIQPRSPPPPTGKTGHFHC